MCSDRNRDTQIFLDSIFDKRRLFNLTPNPERPGVADAAVFLLKNAVLGGVFVSIFAALGHPSFGIILWAAAIEEQGMVTWMRNADRPIRAAIFFRMTLVVIEYLLFGLAGGAFRSVEHLLEYSLDRIVPTMLHIGMLLLACMLMQRQVSWFRIWLICAVCHLSYNSAISLIDP